MTLFCPFCLHNDFLKQSSAPCTLEISAEGEVEYVQEIELDTTSCPLLCFYEESLNLDEYIAKIEIKDGKFRSYNRRGEVLSEIEAEVPNMEGFVNVLFDKQLGFRTFFRHCNWGLITL